MTNARGNSIRIAIVGESNVGKTSILQRFCKGLYGQRIQTTVGIDKSEFSFSVGEDIVSTILLDMAGGNEFVPLVACFLRQVDAVVLVYDISDKESFITLPTWNSLIKSTNASDKLAKILVGNKKDLAKYQREVPFKAAKNFANFEGMVALEVSAKNDDNIDLLFHCIANEVKTLRSTVNDDRRKKAKEKSWSPLALTITRSKAKKPNQLRRIACFEVGRAGLLLFIDINGDQTKRRAAKGPDNINICTLCTFFVGINRTQLTCHRNQFRSQWKNAKQFS
eukprot:gene1531-15977_t